MRSRGDEGKQSVDKRNPDLRVDSHVTALARGHTLLLTLAATPRSIGRDARQTTPREEQEESEKKTTRNESARGMSGVRSCDRGRLRRRPVLTA